MDDLAILLSDGCSNIGKGDGFLPNAIPKITKGGKLWKRKSKKAGGNF